MNQNIHRNLFRPSKIELESMSIEALRNVAIQRINYTVEDQLVLCDLDFISSNHVIGETFSSRVESWTVPLGDKIGGFDLILSIPPLP